LYILVIQCEHPPLQSAAAGQLLRKDTARLGQTVEQADTNLARSRANCVLNWLLTVKTILEQCPHYGWICPTMVGNPTIWTFWIGFWSSIPRKSLPNVCLFV
jgi:hypothetical protein